MGKSTSTDPGPSQSTGKHSPNSSTNSNNSSTTQTTKNRGNKPSSSDHQTQIIPELSLVEPPPGTEPKQRKQRPTGLTYNKNKSGSPSPARSRDSAAAPETVILFQSVIQGVFAVGAGRLGPHWQLTAEEAEGIAVPAANIMAKYMDSDLMAKYSDPLALLIALGVVIAPRVVVNMTVKKKEVKPNGPAAIKPSQPTGGGSREDSRGATTTGNRDSGNDDKAHVNELYGIVDVVDF